MTVSGATLEAMAEPIAKGPSRLRASAFDTLEGAIEGGADTEGSSYIRGDEGWGEARNDGAGSGVGGQRIAASPTAASAARSSSRSIALTPRPPGSVSPV